MPLYDEVLGAARELTDCERARLSDELGRGNRPSPAQVANIDNLRTLCVASITMVAGAIVTYFALDVCSLSGFKQHPLASFLCGHAIAIQKGAYAFGPRATSVLGGVMYALYACLLFGARRSWVQLGSMSALIFIAHLALLRFAEPLITRD